MRAPLKIGQEFALAILPTLVVLAMLVEVDAFTRQRMLFSSLASSAFLIYLDPEHPTNRIKTVILAQGGAALIGFGLDCALGPGLWSAGLAMLLTIVFMISCRVTHPPAVSTALIFAFRANPATRLSLFGFALLTIVILVVLQQASVWAVRRWHPGLRESI